MCVPSVSYSPLKAERLPSGLNVCTFGSGSGAGTQSFKNSLIAAFVTCPEDQMFLYILAR